MRTPRTLARAGLSVAAVLVLTACGGSDDEAPDATATSSAAASTAAGSSAAESTEAAGGDSEAQAFCTEAEQAFAQITNGLDAADPNSLDAALEESVAVFDRIEPPAEIAPDWDALQQAFAGLRDAVAGVDLNTTEGQMAVQEAVADLESRAADPQARVQQYVDTNCGPA
ncbi:hypothetical protein [Modestobacter marinus]|uniref:hypothetical protein n=1 Tax=Modestobacter marinus TaxID=477641 RepID=UPI001C93C939|nr:hypothetical protein [Modestobacter marinus]